MSDVALVDPTPTDWASQAMQKRIRRRYAAERRFWLLGLFAVLLSAGFLAFLLISMMANGIRGFSQTELRLDLDFPRSSLFLDPAALQGFGAEQALANADFDGLVGEAATAQYGATGPRLFSESARLRIRDAVRDNPSILTGTATLWLPAATDIDIAAKSGGTAEAERIYRRLADAGRVRTGLNRGFLTGADFDRSDPGRDLGRVQGFAADDDRHPPDRLSDRGALGGLS